MKPVRARRQPAYLARVARELEEATASEVIGWAVTRFGNRVCVSSSMQDSVLLHLASQVRPGIDVIFLDTGYHFAETLGTRDAVAASYDVNVITVRPGLSVPEQDTLHGPRLYERDPDACCRLRKVIPLASALLPYAAWMSGVRRAESPARAATPVVGWDARNGKVKVNPLATWSDQQVQEYATEHSLLVNPLLMLDYPSVGCAPCTRRVAAGEDARAGRWAGTNKTECGIHT